MANLLSPPNTRRTNPNNIRVFAALLMLLASTAIISAQTSTRSDGFDGKQISSQATKEELVPGSRSADVANDPKENPNGPVKADASTTARVSNAEAISSTKNNEAAAPNPQTGSSDEWQFQFSPFLHLAGLHGTAGIGNRTTQVDESFSDVFHVLNFAFMGTFEARKGKLISLTDLEYVSVSDEKATPGPLFSTVDANFKTFIFDPEVGYRVFENPDNGSSVDVLGGIRVWHVSTDLNFGAGILPALEIQQSRNWVDAVAGLRGRAAISQKMFVTGKFDLGGGGAKFTYQIFGGGGYAVTPKVALIFGWRIE